MSVMIKQPFYCRISFSHTQTDSFDDCAAIQMIQAYRLLLYVGFFLTSSFHLKHRHQTMVNFEESHMEKICFKKNGQEITNEHKKNGRFETD